MTDLHTERMAAARAFTEAATVARLSLNDRCRLLREFLSRYDVSMISEAATANPTMLDDRAEFFVFLTEFRSRFRKYRHMSDCFSRYGVIDITEDEYPSSLRRIGSHPPLLFYEGHPVFKNDLCVAIVGTRSPTSYGIDVTRKVVRDLVPYKPVIISGGAFGIDATAHRTALDVGLKTIAVLGSGVDVPYPASHQPLFEKIVAAGGALVSEFTFGSAPKRTHFPQRNRLIAGMADCVIVTEAGENSGTLITAGFAADYNRDVYAVPGSIFSAKSRSCHRLIKEGAMLLQSVSDLEFVHLDRQLAFDMTTSATAPPSDPEKRIVDLLRAAPASLHTLARKTKLNLPELALTLAKMQQTSQIALERGLYTLKVPLL